MKTCKDCIYFRRTTCYAEPVIIPRDASDPACRFHNNGFMGEKLKQDIKEAAEMLMEREQGGGDE